MRADGKWTALFSVSVPSDACSLRAVSKRKQRGNELRLVPFFVLGRNFAASLRPHDVRDQLMRMREGLPFGIEMQVMGFQIAADVSESFVHGIGELKQLVITFVHGAGADHVAPVENFVPVFSAVNQN